VGHRFQPFGNSLRLQPVVPAGQPLMAFSA
jgi:hypothetical protein